MLVAEVRAQLRDICLKVIIFCVLWGRTKLPCFSRWILFVFVLVQISSMLPFLFHLLPQHARLFFSSFPSEISKTSHVGALSSGKRVSGPAWIMHVSIHPSARPSQQGSGACSDYWLLSSSAEDVSSPRSIQAEAEPCTYLGKKRQPILEGLRMMRMTHSLPEKFEVYVILSGLVETVNTLFSLFLLSTGFLLPQPELWCSNIYRFHQDQHHLVVVLEYNWLWYNWKSHMG